MSKCDIVTVGSVIVDKKNKKLFKPLLNSRGGNSGAAAARGQIKYRSIDRVKEIIVILNK